MVEFIRKKSSRPLLQPRLENWRTLVRRVEQAGRKLPPEFQDAFFELVSYPVSSAALINEQALALAEFSTGRGATNLLAEAQRAQNEIERETDRYNNIIAGGKWRGIMSANPRGQVSLKISDRRQTPAVISPAPPAPVNLAGGAADFVERDHCVVMEAAHASEFVPGKDAGWRRISGLGYNGTAVAVFPVNVPVRATPEQIQAESPCLKFSVWLQTAGDWTVTVRALPTFSVEAGRGQRFALAWDDAPPKVVSLPVSTGERDRQWQENVLRNMAEAVVVNFIGRSGRHTLNVWMVDPGIVLDQIQARTAGANPGGYLGPAETRQAH